MWTMSTSGTPDGWFGEAAVLPLFRSPPHAWLRVLGLVCASRGRCGRRGRSHLGRLNDNAKILPMGRVCRGMGPRSERHHSALVDAPDFPGAVGRAMAFFARTWDDPGERVVGMELHKAQAGPEKR